MHLLSLLGDRIEVYDEGAMCIAWDVSGGLAFVDMFTSTTKTQNCKIKRNEVAYPFFVLYKCLYGNLVYYKR